MEELMTGDRYKENIGELKKYYIDLNYLDLTPASIKDKMCRVLHSFTKVTDYMIGASLNLNLAKKLVKSAKLDKDLAYNATMLTDDVKNQKSKELREAQCSHTTRDKDILLLKASQDELDAAAYHESVKYVYENLSTALSALKEQVKLFQNMLYLDPGGK